MTTSVEPSERTGRLTDVRATRCENLPRSSGSECAARRVADYAAGYAEALADKSGEAVDDFEDCDEWD
jgi:hypothetical protein